MTAYVGNESEVDVYFDDVTVEHRQGLQVQETQYDPMGLELAGLTRDTPGLKPLNQYRWNGKEFQADLGLNWTQLDWRMFDAQIDHMPVVDPEIENGQQSMSPYAFGYDNAVRYNDPDGRYPNGGGGGGLPNDFVARGFFGLGMSIFNLAAQAVATVANTPYKYQSSFVENEDTGQAIGTQIQKVPREGFVSEAKSAGLDGLVVGLTLVGGGGPGKLFEQSAGRVGVAAAGQEARAMKILTKQVATTAADMKAAGQAPASVIGARLPNGDKVVSASGVVPAKVVPKLAKAAEAAGGVGAKNAGNTVGCCGEFQAANKLLKRNPGYSVKDIQFTPAVRPRTGQVVPTCENCGKMFNIK